jgi:hypothetical protein
MLRGRSLQPLWLDLPGSAPQNRAWKMELVQRNIQLRLWPLSHVTGLYICYYAHNCYHGLTLAKSKLLTDRVLIRPEVARQCFIHNG